MISVICPYTDAELMQDCLLNSIKRQTYTDYEFIPLNNRELHLDSAAEVLNYGASLARGEILVFSHQDIQLLDDRAFQRIVDFCKTHEFGLAGVAGTSIAKHKTYSSVIQGPDRTQAGILVSAPAIVDTCDECFFFMKRDGFCSFGDLGKTWHFYAVEYALRCALAGEAVYVVPLSVYHRSPGWSLDKSYWSALLRMAQLYKGSIDVIATTLGIYKNNRFLWLYVLLKRAYLGIKLLVRGSVFS